MPIRRKIKPSHYQADASAVETPVPPKLAVKIQKVFLGPAHLRQMQPIPCNVPQALHWKWEQWVDAAGQEYASVKHGRYKLWYKVTRLAPAEEPVDPPTEDVVGDDHGC